MVNFRLIVLDYAFNEPVPFHSVEAVFDLVLISHEQRTTALQGDADLDARESARPTVNDPADRTRDAAGLKHEDVNGREAAPFSFRHDAG